MCIVECGDFLGFFFLITSELKLTLLTAKLLSKLLLFYEYFKKTITLQPFS